MTDMKSSEFKEIVVEIGAQQGVYIIDVSTERHYIKFLYRGKVWYLQASPHYPWCGGNEPGKWNYIVYDVIAPNTVGQITYWTEWKGFDKLEINRACGSEYLTKNKLDPLMNNAERICGKVITMQGGNREKEMVRDKKVIMTKGHTWNDEHKVVDFVCLKPEDDGYFGGFQIDVVKGEICG